MPTISNVRGKGGKAQEEGAPSIAETVKANANRIERETDSAGRVIGVKRLNFLEIHKITGLVGAVNAQNERYYNEALACASVCEIDGDLVMIPRTELQMDALMLRLDTHGVGAALTALSRFAPPTQEDEAQEVKN